MKTIKFIFSLLVSLVLVIPAWAEADPEVEMYIHAENISAVKGDEVELPIILTSNSPVFSFEFNITLPEGVSFVEKGAGFKYTKVHEGLADWVVIAAQFGNSQTAKVIGYYVSSLDLSLAANEEGAELINLSLSVDEDATLNNAKIIISDQCFATSSTGTQFVPEVDEETASSEIKAVTYADGYSVKIMPFVMDIADDYEDCLYVETAADLSKIEFDVAFSSVIKNNSLAELARKIGTTNATTSIDAGHVSIAAKSGKKITNETQIVKLTIGNDPETLGNSVHTIFIKNIVVTDLSGNVINVAPYSADFYTGEKSVAPITNGDVSFHGDYSDGDMLAKMKAAIPTTDETITTLDFTAVTAIPEGTESETISLANPNAIIRTTDVYSVANTKNVVIGKSCTELQLTDKYAFANTKKFTATKASYSRSMTDHSWGTLCLPFAASMSGANVYTLKEINTAEINSEEEGLMTFEKQESTSIDANKPYVIKKTANDVTFSANSAEIAVTPDACTAETGVTGWTLTGTTVDINFSEEETAASSYYYINGNSFWKAAAKLHVAPFRAYFEYIAPEGGDTAKFRIEEETNGIEAIEAEAETGVFYDLQGRTVKAPQAGQFYIQGSKKYIVK